MHNWLASLVWVSIQALLLPIKSRWSPVVRGWMRPRVCAGSVVVQASLKFSKFIKRAVVATSFCIYVMMRWNILSRGKLNRSSINIQTILVCQLKCKKRFGKRKRLPRVRSLKAAKWWRRMNGKRLTQQVRYGHVIRVKSLMSNTSSFIKTWATILQSLWHGRITVLRAAPNIPSCCISQVRRSRTCSRVRQRRASNFMLNVYSSWMKQTTWFQTIYVSFRAWWTVPIYRWMSAVNCYKKAVMSKPFVRAMLAVF